ncbi:MAG: DUF3579 domain-containing protein [Gammaproteobacteria bacterium]
MEDKGRLVIEGIRDDGARFRPSDWSERIAATLARFGPDHRLHYSDAVHPCVIGGTKCLVVERGLRLDDPAAFEFIMEFARANELRVLEDRRQEERPVGHDRRHG